MKSKTVLRMKKLSIIKFIFCFLLFSILFYGCNHKESTVPYQPVFSSDTSEIKTLVWGFPSFSYCQNAELIVQFLNKHLTGAHIVVKSCVSWDEYVEHLNKNEYDLTLVNGIQALDAANKGYSITGKIMNDSQYTGVIFTRKDAGIKTAGDLKGKKIAYAPSNVIPGTMMCLYYLQQHGLNVNSDIQKVDVSSFESAIIATYVDKSDAGLSLKRSWNVYVRDHPEVLEKVEFKWETPPLVHNALLIKNNTDKKIADELLSLFFSMQTTSEGKAALKRLDVEGFEKANNETYKPMMDFKRKYDAVIQ
jgi:ABC-type phosphate/phosphonate transport system substrate-binding protein